MLGLIGCYTPPKDLVHVNRAGTLSVEGRHAEALAECNKALMINPWNHWAYSYRGSIYVKQGKYDQAIKEYKRALELSPGDEASIMGYETALQLQMKDVQSQYDPTPVSGGRAGQESPKAYAALQPGIHVHRLEMKPEKVSPKSDFDLFVEFSVWDPSKDLSYVPVTFRYMIFEGERILFKSKSVNITAPTGKRTPRVVHLTAADKRGTYKIQVRFKYRNKMSGETVMFTIE
jgi:tetratricopeptide (TPR) repeat protein